MRGVRFGRVGAVRGRRIVGSRGGQARLGVGIVYGRGWRSWRCVGRVGKNVFVNNYVAGDNNATWGEVIATITFVLKGVAKENIVSRVRGELVIHGGVEVRVAQTAEDAEMVVRGVDTMETKVRRVMNGTGGAAIEQVGGCV